MSYKRLVQIENDLTCKHFSTLSIDGAIGDLTVFYGHIRQVSYELEMQNGTVPM
jgi:hypothetical protein